MKRPCNSKQSHVSNFIDTSGTRGTRTHSYFFSRSAFHLQVLPVGYIYS